MSWKEKGTALALALLLTGCGAPESTSGLPAEAAPSMASSSQVRPESSLSPVSEVSVGESSFSAPAETDLPAMQTGLVREQLLDSEESPIHYSYFLPENYDGQKAYPLVMTMPGYDRMWFGEDSSGSNLTWNGFTAWTEYPEEMIVVSAQLTDWGETSAKQAVCLTEHFIENFAVDKSRVYAAGYSAGGETMSRAVAMRPDLYAAYLHGGSQWDGDGGGKRCGGLYLYGGERRILWLPEGPRRLQQSIWGIPKGRIHRGADRGGFAGGDTGQRLFQCLGHL